MGTLKSWIKQTYIWHFWDDASDFDPGLMKIKTSHFLKTVFSGNPSVPIKADGIVTNFKIIILYFLSFF